MFLVTHPERGSLALTSEWQPPNSWTIVFPTFLFLRSSLCSCIFFFLFVFVFAFFDCREPVAECSEIRMEWLMMRDTLPLHSNSGEGSRSLVRPRRERGGAAAGGTLSLSLSLPACSRLLALASTTGHAATIILTGKTECSANRWSRRSQCLAFGPGSDVKR